MRIAYGVFGYGRGHATRTAAVLPELTRRHEVLIFAGGDAYDALFTQYPIVRIPTLAYAYTSAARRSNYLTIKHNVWPVLDMLFRGPTFQAMCKEMSEFRPQVVISDAEPWVHRVAHRLGIPRIAFDHFGILVHCRPPIPWADHLASRGDACVYRLLMGRPQRVIVSSFYDAPARHAGVRVIGPLLRDEVLRATPTHGPHLLAYFNKGEHHFTPHVERALRDVALPVRVYGTPRFGHDGNLTFCTPSALPFVEDLASCRAVISTAGNQLVGEALHLGKPLLVMPEDCVEQRLNASAVVRLGVGASIQHRDFSVAAIRAFLGREDEYRASVRRHARDGRREALTAIEQYLTELAGPSPQQPDPVRA